ncbi:hypothetical protein [Streptacidiphilus sp. PAMC 29251]|jgi:hypothetical protein
MSAQHVWTVEVTDSRGHSAPVEDATFPNPYVSDETAEQIAERLLQSLAPAHTAGDGPVPQRVTVRVWRDVNASGDPLAEASWTGDPQ